MSNNRQFLILGRDILHSWREFVISLFGIASSACAWLIHSIQYEPHMWTNLGIISTGVISALGFAHKVISTYFQLPSHF